MAKRKSKQTSKQAKIRRLQQIMLTLRRCGVTAAEVYAFQMALDFKTEAAKVEKEMRQCGDIEGNEDWTAVDEIEAAMDLMRDDSGEAFRFAEDLHELADKFARSI